MYELTGKIYHTDGLKLIISNCTNVLLYNTNEVDF